MTASDIYSLGVLARELLVERVPRGSSPELFDLQPWIERLCAPDPLRRPTAVQALLDLESLTPVGKSVR